MNIRTIQITYDTGEVSETYGWLAMGVDSPEDAWMPYGAEHEQPLDWDDRLAAARQVAAEIRGECGAETRIVWRGPGAGQERDL